MAGKVYRVPHKDNPVFRSRVRYLARELYHEPTMEREWDEEPGMFCVEVGVLPNGDYKTWAELTRRERLQICYETAWGVIVEQQN